MEALCSISETLSVPGITLSGLPEGKSALILPLSALCLCLTYSAKYATQSDSLNLGNTLGVFNDSTFVGLMLQIPINISFITAGKPYIKIMLMTSEVEIFNGNIHFIYFNWQAGNPLPNPIGQIDDAYIVPDMPEYHLLKIDTQGLATGNHTITIIVNNNVPLGLKDDFVIHKIDADNDAGMKVGSM